MTWTCIPFSALSHPILQPGHLLPFQQVSCKHFRFIPTLPMGDLQVNLQSWQQQDSPCAAGSGRRARGPAWLPAQLAARGRLSGCAGYCTLSNGGTSHRQWDQPPGSPLLGRSHCPGQESRKEVQDRVHQETRKKFHSPKVNSPQKSPQPSRRVSLDSYPGSTNRDAKLVGTGISCSRSESHTIAPKNTR